MNQLTKSFNGVLTTFQFQNRLIFSIMSSEKQIHYIELSLNLDILLSTATVAAN